MRFSTMVELPSRSVRDYLAQFGVTAIYITCSCMLGVGCDLARAGPVAAAWLVRDRARAEQILVAIGEHHPGHGRGCSLWCGPDRAFHRHGPRQGCSEQARQATRDGQGNRYAGVLQCRVPEAPDCGACERQELYELRRGARAPAQGARCSSGGWLNAGAPAAGVRRVIARPAGIPPSRIEWGRRGQGRPLVRYFLAQLPPELPPDFTPRGGIGDGDEGERARETQIEWTHRDCDGIAGMMRTVLKPAPTCGRESGPSSFEARASFRLRLWMALRLARAPQHDGPVRRGHGVRDVAGPEEGRGTPLPTLPRLDAKEQWVARAQGELLPGPNSGAARA
jgi:hypothetical protein